MKGLNKEVAFVIDSDCAFADLLLRPASLASLFCSAVAKANRNGFRDYQLALSAFSVTGGSQLACRITSSDALRDCERSIACSSCDMTLSLGVLLGARNGSPLDMFENRVLLLRESSVARVWLDAKKRSMLVRGCSKDAVSDL